MGICFNINFMALASQYLTLSITLFSIVSKDVIADTIKLPSIGSSSGNSISTQEEYRLGQEWLRLFRRQSPIINDPIINHYVENLLARLTSHSPLHQQQLSVIVVDNPMLNAFAVPGGVIGVHTGLFAFADNEQQFASVLSHELAHLSQRHYARSLQQQRSQTIPTMAALLASLVVLATTDGDAGIAALTATQA